MLPRGGWGQVAEQQGRYLARMLNREESSKEKGDAIEEQPFVYRQLGMMASIGESFLRLLSPGIGKVAQIACKLSTVLINVGATCHLLAHQFQVLALLHRAQVLRLSHMSLQPKSHASVRGEECDHD